MRWRSISKLALPDPMITAARNSVTGTGPSASTAPTSCRLLKCSDSAASSRPSPPRYTSWATPALAAASRNVAAPARSRSANSAVAPIECTR